jgi:hypothetical protein
MNKQWVVVDQFGYPRVMEADEYLMVLYFEKQQEAQRFLDENEITGHRIVRSAVGDLVRKVAPSIASIDATNDLLAELAADAADEEVDE